MAKAKPPVPPPVTELPDLFAGAARRDRKYRALILPRFLATASMGMVQKWVAVMRLFAIAIRLS